MPGQCSSSLFWPSLSGIGIRLFQRRDIGGIITVPGGIHVASHHAGESGPSGAWSLTTVFTRSLRSLLWPTVWWTVGIAGFAAWMVIVVAQMETKLDKLLAGSPAAITLIRDLGGSSTLIIEGFL